MAREDEVRHPSGWVLRYGDRKAEVGWSHLLAQAPTNTAHAWEQIISDPRRTTTRQHQLRGPLKTGTYRGRTLEQWQYEVTGGGRLWYLIDEETTTLWLVYASTADPRATDRSSR